MAEPLANEPTTPANTPAPTADATTVAASDNGTVTKASVNAKAKAKAKVKVKPAPRAAVKVVEPKRAFLRGAFRSPVDERRRLSPVTPHPVMVPPIRKQKEKAAKPRLRILIAGDPKKPMRQIS